MARCWSGFVPQNQFIKEQWCVLEASQGQILERLEALRAAKDEENETLPQDDEDSVLIRMHKPPR